MSSIVPFTRQDLIDAIKNGNDSVDNSVVVTLGGKVQVVPLDVAQDNPAYAVRNETFDAENGYIGIDASVDDNHIDQVFDAISKAWNKHTQYGGTIYTDGSDI